MSSSASRLDQAKAIIHRHMLYSMGIGLVPVPGIDLAGLWAQQLYMLKEIGAVYGVTFSDEWARRIIGTFVGGLAPRGILLHVMSLLQIVPGVGHLSILLAFPVACGACTYALGWLFLRHFESGGTPETFDAPKKKDEFARRYREGKQVAAKQRRQPATPKRAADRPAAPTPTRRSTRPGSAKKPATAPTSRTRKTDPAPRQLLTDPAIADPTTGKADGAAGKTTTDPTTETPRTGPTTSTAVPDPMAAEDDQAADSLRERLESQQDEQKNSDERQTQLQQQIRDLADAAAGDQDANETAHLQAELDKQKAQHEQADRNYDEIKQDLGKLKQAGGAPDEIDKLQDEIEQLARQHKQQADVLDQSQSELDAIKNAEQATADKRDDLRQEIEEQQTRQEADDDRLAELEKSIQLHVYSDLQDQDATETGRLQQQLDERKPRHKDAGDKIEQLKKKLSPLQEEGRAPEELAALQNEIAALQQKYMRQGERLDECQAELDAQRQKEKEATTKRNAFRERVDDHKKQQQAKDDSLTQLQKKLQQHCGTAPQVQDAKQSDELQELIDQAKNEHDETGDKLGQLKDELEQLKQDGGEPDELNELQQQLNEQEKQHRQHGELLDQFQQDLDAQKQKEQQAAGERDSLRERIAARQGEQQEESSGLQQLEREIAAHAGTDGDNRDPSVQEQLEAKLDEGKQKNATAQETLDELKGGLAALREEGRAPEELAELQSAIGQLEAKDQQHAELIGKLQAELDKAQQPDQEVASLVSAAAKPASEQSVWTPAGEAEPPCSGTDGRAAKVTFENESGNRVKLIWIGFDGTQKVNAELDPGSKREQDTFVDHTWLVTDENDQPLGHYVITADTKHLVIPGAAQPTPKPTTEAQTDSGLPVAPPREPSLSEKSLLEFLAAQSGVHTVTQIAAALNQPEEELQQALDQLKAQGKAGAWKGSYGKPEDVAGLKAIGEAALKHLTDEGGMHTAGKLAEAIDEPAQEVQQALHLMLGAGDVACEHGRYGTQEELDKWHKSVEEVAEQLDKGDGLQTATDIAKATGKSPGEVQKALDQLKNENKIAEEHGRYGKPDEVQKSRSLSKRVLERLAQTQSLDTPAELAEALGEPQEKIQQSLDQLKSDAEVGDYNGRYRTKAEVDAMRELGNEITGHLKEADELKSAAEIAEELHKPEKDVQQALDDLKSQGQVGKSDDKYGPPEEVAELKQLGNGIVAELKKSSPQTAAELAKALNKPVQEVQQGLDQLKAHDKVDDLHGRYDLPENVEKVRALGARLLEELPQTQSLDTPGELAAKLGVPEEEVQRALDQLQADGEAKSLNGRYGTPEEVARQAALLEVMQFDGVDDYVELPDIEFDYSQGFTVEAWVRYASFNHWSRIIELGNQHTDNLVFANYRTAAKLAVAVQQEGVWKELVVNGLEQGKWMHLATAVDGAGNAKLYRDGQQLAGLRLLAPSSVKRVTNYIARSNFSGDAYFHGEMSDLRLWNKTLSAAEIQADKDRRLNGDEDGLACYWPLSEIDEHNHTPDLAGHHPGTVHGAMTTRSEDLQLVPREEDTDSSSKDVLKFIKEDEGTHTQDEIAEATGKSPEEVQKALEQLKEEGEIDESNGRYGEPDQVAAEQVTREATRAHLQEQGGLHSAEEIAQTIDKPEGDVQTALDQLKEDGEADELNGKYGTDDEVGQRKANAAAALACLKEHEGLQTAEEVAERIGQPLNEVQAALNDLLGQGAIVTENGRYGTPDELDKWHKTLGEVTDRLDEGQGLQTATSIAKATGKALDEVQTALDQLKDEKKIDEEQGRYGKPDEVQESRDSAQQILNRLTETKSLDTPAELAEVLGKPQNEVQTALDQLRQQGAVEEDHGDYGTPEEVAKAKTAQEAVLAQIAESEKLQTAQEIANAVDQPEEEVQTALDQLRKQDEVDELNGKFGPPADVAQAKATAAAARTYLKEHDGLHAADEVADGLGQPLNEVQAALEELVEQGDAAAEHGHYGTPDELAKWHKTLEDVTDQLDKGRGLQTATQVAKAIGKPSEEVQKALDQLKDEAKIDERNGRYGKPEDVQASQELAEKIHARLAETKSLDTASELAEALGEPQEQIQQSLDQLKSDGEVGDYNGRYGKKSEVDALRELGNGIRAHLKSAGSLQTAKQIAAGLDKPEDEVQNALDQLKAQSQVGQWEDEYGLPEEVAERSDLGDEILARLRESGLQSAAEIAAAMSKSSDEVQAALDPLKAHGKVDCLHGRYDLPDEVEAVRALSTKILDELPKTEDLDTPAELAEQLGVSPKAVQTALDELQTDGSVKQHNGRYGTPEQVDARVADLKAIRRQSLEYLKEHVGLQTADEIARAIHKPEGEVKNTLAQLEEEGILNDLDGGFGTPDEVAAEKAAEESVLGYLKDQKGLQKPDEAAQGTGKSPEQVQRALQRLVDQGAIAEDHGRYGTPDEIEAWRTTLDEVADQLGKREGLQTPAEIAAATGKPVEEVQRALDQLKQENQVDDENGRYGTPEKVNAARELATKLEEQLAETKSLDTVNELATALEEPEAKVQTALDQLKAAGEVGDINGRYGTKAEVDALRELEESISGHLKSVGGLQTAAEIAVALNKPQGEVQRALDELRNQGQVGEWEGEYGTPKEVAELTELGEEVLAHLKESGLQSPAELAAALGKPAEEVQAALDQLKAHSKVDDFHGRYDTPDEVAKLRALNDKVLKQLPKSQGFDTAAELAEALGMPEKQVQAALDDLKAEGKVKAYDGRYGLPEEVERQIEIDNLIPQVTTLAGSGGAGRTNAQGSAATFNYPVGVAADASGVVYVTDSSNQHVRKVFPDGVTVPFAGSGAGTADGWGPAAQFHTPCGIAVGPNGMIYVVDNGYSIVRKITPGGHVTTLAGAKTAGYADGNGSRARFNRPNGLAIDAEGVLYVADKSNHRIRKVTPKGVVTTLAGSGKAGCEDGAAKSASFNQPHGIAVDSNGTVYVADYGNHRIRKISPQAEVTTLAGTGQAGFTNGPADEAKFYYPIGVMVDGSGVVYVVDYYNHRLRVISPAGVVTTLAGSGAAAHADGKGEAAKFYYPRSMTVSSSGVIYVADHYNHRVRRLVRKSAPAADIKATCNAVLAFYEEHPALHTAKQISAGVGMPEDRVQLALDQLVAKNTLQEHDRRYGSPEAIGKQIDLERKLPEVTTLAGSGGRGAANARGAKATFNYPIGITSAPSGIVYVTDVSNQRIRKVFPDGLVTSLAGSGAGVADGWGPVAKFYTPFGIAVDRAENIFVIDNYYSIIRKVTPDGHVTTFAGAKTAGYIDATGVKARFNKPTGLAIDAKGVLYVADSGSHHIRKITPAGEVTTLAGNGKAGYGNGPGQAAAFNQPNGVAVDSEGVVYVADYANHRIRKITPEGVVSTFAGSGEAGYNDGRVEEAKFNYPVGVMVGDAGIVYIVDYYNHRIRQINPDGIVTTLAGSGAAAHGDGLGEAAKFYHPRNMTASSSGTLYVADHYNHRVRKLVPSSDPEADRKSTGEAVLVYLKQHPGLHTPEEIAAGTKLPEDEVQPALDLLIREKSLQEFAGRYGKPDAVKAASARDKKVPIVTTLAGSGRAAYGNDTGTAAHFNYPCGIAADASGVAYVTEAGNHRVRKVFPDGAVTTLAGSGAGVVDGWGATAKFYTPSGIVVDKAGVVYVVDNYYSILRKVTPDGCVTILAGAKTAGYADGKGSAARFNKPTGLAIDSQGTLYVADTSGHRIRKVTPDGDVSTLAGNGAAGYANGPGTNASFNAPYSVSVDARGFVYVADHSNHRIRKISPDGLVSTLAGCGDAGYENGRCESARFNGPIGVLVDDASGVVYVADYYNHRIREISPDGIVTTLTGNSSAAHADGLGEAAKFNYPRSIAKGPTGILYVADHYNHRVRKVVRSADWTTDLKSTRNAALDYVKSHQGLETVAQIAAAVKQPEDHVQSALDQLVEQRSLSPWRDRYGTPDSVKTQSDLDKKIPAVTTLAGSGGKGGTNARGSKASFNYPIATAADNSGIVYVTDCSNHRIRKVFPDGEVTTLAGGGAGVLDGWGTAANFYNPSGIAVNRAGIVYVVDTYYSILRRITPDGHVTTLAGAKTAGYVDGKGTQARFNKPTGIAVDAKGMLYVADTSNHRIRKVTPDGEVTTVAGNGKAGYVNGAARESSFNQPYGLSVDGAGNIYVADHFNHRIRKISPQGLVSTFAGNGEAGYTNGRAEVAKFNRPIGVVCDVSGMVYVVDYNNHRIRQISPDGIVTTLAGSGQAAHADGLGEAAKLYHPRSLTMAPSGTMYVCDHYNHRIRKLVPGIDPGAELKSSGATILAYLKKHKGLHAAKDIAAGMKLPEDEVQPALDLLIKEGSLQAFDDRYGDPEAVKAASQLDKKVPRVTTLAGSGGKGATNAKGAKATFHYPIAVAADPSGIVYVTDASNHRIRKVFPDGQVTTLAGSGAAGSADGWGPTAVFYNPSGIAIDGLGMIYVADNYYSIIRKITPDGHVTTLAGAKTAGYADGKGVKARFNKPTGLAIDGEGTVYVADTSGHRIRKVSPAGEVTTLAGAGNAAYVNGAGTVAGFNQPYGVAVDSQGNVYVADHMNHRIRKITPDGVVSTFAGCGEAGYTNGRAETARFNRPIGVMVDDSTGVVYVADYYNHRIREISPDGMVTTLTGSGIAGHGDGMGEAAKFYHPRGLALSKSGTIYVADHYNHRIRKLVRSADPDADLQSAGDAVRAYLQKQQGLHCADDIARAVKLPGDEVQPALDLLVKAGSVQAFDDRYGEADAVKAASQLDKRVPCVTTLAGSGGKGATNAKGAKATFHYPVAVATDSTGVLYVTDVSNHRIRKVFPDGQVTTLAGSGAAGMADGWGPTAVFYTPCGIAVDGPGMIYVADNYYSIIRKITPDGHVTTLAGAKTAGYVDGKGTKARFNKPTGLAIDGEGTLYVADTNGHRIRKVTPAGEVTTLAGNGKAAYVNGPGANAGFNQPYGVAVDSQGNVYVADHINHRIRKITPGGVVSTFAGCGEAGYTDGRAETARFNRPIGVMVDDSRGVVYVADYYNHRIREIGADGMVTTLTGSGAAGHGDGMGEASKFYHPRGLAMSVSGTIYVADHYNHRIRKVVRSADPAADLEPLGQVVLEHVKSHAGLETADAIAAALKQPLDGVQAALDQLVAKQSLTQWQERYGLAETVKTASDLDKKLPEVTTLAGSGGAGGANAKGKAATFNYPTGIAVDGSGIVYLSDTSNHRIRKIFPDGVSTTLAGSGAGVADGWGPLAKFHTPLGIAVDRAGTVYVADHNYSIIRRVTPDGHVTILAGAKTAGFVDAKGAAARFNHPIGVAVDAQGALYVADRDNHRIRKVSPEGDVTTLAGNGKAGYANGQAASASFNQPHGISVDASGNVFVADYANHRIRKIDPQGVVSTVAGCGEVGYTNGRAEGARFNYPIGVLADTSGMVYVVDYYNHRLRAISSDGIVTTLAGSGTAAHADGLGEAARFYYPRSMAASPSGLLYVADHYNHRVRKLVRGAEMVTDPAATGKAVTTYLENHDGPQTAAFVAAGIDQPEDQVQRALDQLVSAGTLKVRRDHYGTAEEINALLEFDKQHPKVTTLAGSGRAAFGDGEGTAAHFNYPQDMAVSSRGIIHVAEYNHRVRSITPDGTVTTLAGSTAGRQDGRGTAARFHTPIGVAIDDSDTVYIADHQYCLIRKVTSDGKVTTLAGAGAAGFVDGTGTAARFRNPYGLAIDTSGVIYVGDSNNHRIRKIGTDGKVMTFAGNGTASYANGAAHAASFNQPRGLAIDAEGNLYVADYANHRIRKISPKGVVTTLAGNGEAGHLDGRAEAAKFYHPNGLIVDDSGVVYVADFYNHRIRMVAPDGMVSTLAGSGSASFADGVGQAAKLYHPLNLALSPAGVIYIADHYNHRVRKLELATPPSASLRTVSNSVLNFLQDNAGVHTLAEIVEATGKPQGQVRPALQRLVADEAAGKYTGRYGNPAEVARQAEHDTQQAATSVLKLDGKSSISFASKDDFRIPRDMTIEAWIHATSSKKWAGILSKVYDTGATESGYGLTLSGGSEVYFALTPTSTKRIIYQSAPMPLREWHHVACTWNGSQMLIYIDGELKAAQDVPSDGIHHSPDNDLNIGSYKDDNEDIRFTGKVAEVRLWSVCRTPEQIRANKDWRLTGNEAGLVGYWPLATADENGQTPDCAGNNPGTVHGATIEQDTDLRLRSPSETGPDGE